MNPKIKKIRDSLDVIRVAHTVNLEQLNKSFENEAGPLKEKLRILIEKCRHEDRYVYKDYYSKIIICNDCGTGL